MYRRDPAIHAGWSISSRTVGNMPTIIGFMPSVSAARTQRPQSRFMLSPIAEKTLAVQFAGIGIQFEIELGQFGNDARIVGCGNELIAMRCRQAIAVEKPGFEFEADSGSPDEASRPSSNQPLRMPVSWRSRSRNALWSASENCDCAMSCPKGTSLFAAQP